MLKALAEQRRIRHEKQLEDIIERGGDKRLLARCQKKPAAKKRISEMMNANGEIKNDLKEIAQIFAEFYEKLYASSQSCE